MVVSGEMNSCWAALVDGAIDSYRGKIAGYMREAYLAMPHRPPSGVGSYVGPLGLLLGCHTWYIGLDLGVEDVVGGGSGHVVKGGGGGSSLWVARVAAANTSA